MQNAKHTSFFFLDHSFYSLHLLAAWAAGLILLSGCVSTPNIYTTENSKRENQQMWIEEDLVTIFAKFYGERIRESPPAMRSELADLNKIIQTCYLKGSAYGTDVDGGVRAMNFFKRRFFVAKGDYWSWHRAINYQPTTYEEKQSYVYIIGIPKGYK